MQVIEAKTKYGVVKVPQKMLEKIYVGTLSVLFYRAKKLLLTPVMRNIWKDVVSDYLSKAPRDFHKLRIEPDFSDMPSNYKKLIDEAKKQNRLKTIEVEFSTSGSKYFNAVLVRQTNAQGATDKFTMVLELSPFFSSIKQSMHSPVFEIEKKIKEGANSSDTLADIEKVKARIKAEVDDLLDQIHASIEHELQHYVQHSILPQEQTKKNTGYDSDSMAYYTSPVEFGPMLQSLVRDFTSSYKWFLRNLAVRTRHSPEYNFLEKVTDEILKLNLELLTGEKDYGKLRNDSRFFDKHTYEGEFLLSLSYVPNDFMEALNKSKSTAYQKAVKYIHRQAFPIMKRERERLLKNTKR